VTLPARTSRYVVLGHLPVTRHSSAVMSILSVLAKRLRDQLLPGLGLRHRDG